MAWFDATEPTPWQVDESAQLVVIDNCDRLDEARQQAAFAAFIEATTHGAQLAAAGTLPPVDMPVRDDLRSRLGWGHVFALEPLGRLLGHRERIDLTLAPGTDAQAFRASLAGLLPAGVTASTPDIEAERDWEPVSNLVSHLIPAGAAGTLGNTDAVADPPGQVDPARHVPALYEVLAPFIGEHVGDTAAQLGSANTFTALQTITLSTGRFGR